MDFEYFSCQREPLFLKKPYVFGHCAFLLLQTEKPWIIDIHSIYFHKDIYIWDSSWLRFDRFAHTAHVCMFKILASLLEAQSENLTALAINHFK